MDSSDKEFHQPITRFKKKEDSRHKYKEDAILNDVELELDDELISAKPVTPSPQNYNPNEEK